jgi:peptidoglycan/xylan/chitin deacetylase (PgdA/CDA1 family)
MQLETHRGWKIVRRLYDMMPFAKTVQMRNQRPIISFAFDDFPRSAVSNGARILEQYSARGTFYAVGSYCDQVIDGVAYFHNEDLSVLFSAGHEIGCHTFHHRRVSELTASGLTEEINLNAAFIARHLPDVSMHSFAYPFGDVSLSAKMNLQRTFTTCRGTGFGLNTLTVDLGRLQAVRLYNRVINLEEIFALIQEAVSTNAWLIFYTHDVGEVPSDFGCTETLLEHAVNMALSAGVDILPVSAAAKIICDAEI